MEVFILPPLELLFDEPKIDLVVSPNMEELLPNIGGFWPKIEPPDKLVPVPPNMDIDCVLSAAVDVEFATPEKIDSSPTFSISVKPPNILPGFIIEQVFGFSCERLVADVGVASSADSFELFVLALKVFTSFFLKFIDALGGVVINVVVAVEIIGDRVLCFNKTKGGNSVDKLPLANKKQTVIEDLPIPLLNLHIQAS
uniref:Uncharacterized protein n=1 Tax=Glossina austeni TaxID=7395 RepID=A0A1A9VEI6_GLOAU